MLASKDLPSHCKRMSGIRKWQGAAAGSVICFHKAQTLAVDMQEIRTLGIEPCKVNTAVMQLINRAKLQLSLQQIWGGHGKQIMALPDALEGRADRLAVSITVQLG